jgi:hypothetical protein
MMGASGALLFAVGVGCSSTTITYKVVDEKGREQEVIARDSSGSPIKVESSSIDKIAQITPKLKKLIETNLKKKAEEGKFYSKYNIPSDEQIKSLVSFLLIESDMVSIRQLAETLTREGEKNIVWPIWISAIKARVVSIAEKFLATGDFANAREVVWRCLT